MASEDLAARLYGLPLDEFVAERTKAAKAAKDAGEKEEAAAIAALRKPTLAAWTVNQLARRERRDVDLLLDSGKRLLDAQRATLEQGGRSDLDRARSSFDAAIARLGEAAARLLGERASEETLARVHETLRSAAIAPDGRELLATGTFVKETTGTGWDVLASIGADLGKAPPRARGKAPATKRPAPPAQAERERRAALRDELREARRRRDELARKLREAEREEARASAALDAASKQRERAEKALEEADAEVARAEEALET